MFGEQAHPEERLVRVPAQGDQSTTSLVLILGEFGITHAGARAAIALLARRGILVSTRSGRTTAYAMTERCAWMASEGRRLTLEFTGAMRAWDGRWTLVSYSIAQERRTRRALLRTRLRWLGFAPISDDLWISPRPPSQLLHDALTDLAVGSCAVFLADPVPGPDRLDPLAAWDLDEERDSYAAFIDEFRPVSEDLRHGRVSASEALIARTRLTCRWFAFASSQTELPQALRPPDENEIASINRFSASSSTKCRVWSRGAGIGSEHPSESPDVP